MNLIIKFFTFFVLISNASIFTADYEVRNERLQLSLDAVILAQNQQNTALLDERFLEKIEAALIKIVETYPEFKEIHPQSPVAPNNLMLHINDTFDKNKLSEKFTELNGMYDGKIHSSIHSKRFGILNFEKKVDIYIIQKLYIQNIPEINFELIGIAEHIEHRHSASTGDIELDTKSENWWIFTITDKMSNKYIIDFDQTRLNILRRINT